MSNSDGATFEELLQFVYLTPIGIIKFDSDGTIDLMNPAATAMLMSLLPIGDLANFYDSLMPLIPDLRQRVRRSAGKVGAVLKQQHFEMLVGDDVVVLSLTLQRVNEMVYMAVIEDVTTVVEQGRKLAAHELRFRAIFENVREYAIFTITLEGLIEEWNQSLHRFGDWAAPDVEAVSLSIFFPNDDPNGSGPQVDTLLDNAKRTGSVETETWLLTRDGSRLWANMIITALPDLAGAPSGFVVVASDLTERKRIEDSLRELATVDPLTGAFNRRHGHASLAQEFERRTRSGQPFAAMMLDIDWFKSINDRFGHDSGDAVLCAMVTACRSTLRALDVLVRWGGEEFLVVMPGANQEGAVVAAERVRERLAAIQVSAGDNESISFTVSIGVAICVDGDVVENLLHRADEALYAAKAGGRNRVVLG